MLHESPERPWDVKTLAAKVGMSPSVFVNRFVDVVGEAPLAYLTRWRLQLAARLLRVPGATVALTGEQVGYDSELAFSHAFRQHLGMWPKPFHDRKNGQARRPAATRVKRGGAGCPPKKRGGAPA
jgi:AraC-like DNA-binding protein